MKRSPEDVIPELEVKIAMAFGQCESLEEVGAVLGALYSTTHQSFRLRAEELGATSEQIDKISQVVDGYMFEHPEAL